VCADARAASLRCGERASLRRADAKAECAFQIAAYKECMREEYAAKVARRVAAGKR